MSRDNRVAIVGVGGIFPRCPDLARFWANVVEGVATTREVPPGRWRLEPQDAYDPRVGLPDHVYSTRGCFVEGFRFDPEGLDLDPNLVARLDLVYHLSLHAARAAWRDARTDELNRGRVGVVFGNLVLPTETASDLAQGTLGRTFAERAGFGSDEEDDHPIEPLNARPAGSPAGVVARGLGLGGGSFTLDAACASSLYAIKLAADELIAGRVDAMICGGVSRPDPLYTQMGFAQLRALSPSGVASPFGLEADGLVVGEGAGMFVLKRLGDALKQGDRVYGVIGGVGVSNDVDGGLLAPDSEGQLRAIRAAYAQAGWRPGDVDLIECHATGTPVGDAVEFASLRALWASEDRAQNSGRCVIGSVKSNIGHTLTAAGASGLIKVLLGFRHEVLPPTAGFDRPSAKIDLETSPFRVLGRAEPWPRRDDRTPRRAALSGFGFGGINAHVLIEEWVPGLSPEPVPIIDASESEAEPIAVITLAARFGPWDSLEAVRARLLGGMEDSEPAPPPEQAWWGATEADWFARAGGNAASFPGYRIDQVELPTDRFRIPPRELEEMLPQQSLILRLAAEATGRAGWVDDGPRLKTGAIVGLGLDLNATNFHVRWTLLNRARAWNEDRGLNLSESELAAWVEELRGSIGPALSANRTMGALGSIVASRVAREFRLGGPSFTVSSEETSGLRALDVACGLLRKGELDEALVGAVDLPGDLRASLALETLDPGATVGDGAAVLILKRLADAERDGDPILAQIRGSGFASGLGADPAGFAESVGRALDRSKGSTGTLGWVGRSGLDPATEDRAIVGLIEGAAPGSIALASASERVGQTGAASGMAALVQAILGLNASILPPVRREIASTAPNPSSPLFAPKSPQFWLSDRDRGPRRALVGSVGTDGNVAHVVVERFEANVGGLDVPPAQPLGDRPAGLFAWSGSNIKDLLDGLGRIEALIRAESDRGVEPLARLWFASGDVDPSDPLAMAIVADGRGSLARQVEAARRRLLARPGSTEAQARPGEMVALSLRPLALEGDLAFVFPAMGNHFAAMGRDLAAHWPQVLRRQDAENDMLRSQIEPGSFWNAGPPERFDDHRPPIFGQVTLGTIVADLLRGLGVEPTASIGQSLGETTAMFALRGWTDRDAMYRRFAGSPLFGTDLAGPRDAARVTWNLPEDEPVDWVTAIVPTPPDRAIEALQGVDRAYLLLINTDEEVVIGGQGGAVAEVVDRLGGKSWPLPTVSTVHCEVVRAVKSAYRGLHLLPTAPPTAIRFYSGATGQSYPLSEDSAADAILGQALETVDFPRLIRQAYADGVRGFVEVGPGGSCTRMVGAILGDQPHLAVAACPSDREPVAALLWTLARLVAERFPVDLARLYGPVSGDSTPKLDPRRTVRIPVGGGPFRPPSIPSPRPVEPSFSEDEPVLDPFDFPFEELEPVPDLVASMSHDRTTVPNGFATSTAQISISDPLRRQWLATDDARGGAHSAFLRFSDGIGGAMARQIAFQVGLIDQWAANGGGGGSTLTPPDPNQAEDFGPVMMPPRALDRDACLQFAVGSIAAVLGPDFSEVDAHPTRVRLPDEPLMLVDRILTIEGEPRSMGSGRVVTEHDIHPGAWYLDAGVIPTCIAVESGQADLLLSAFLGIDFETRGLAVYRLLDAVVTFDRPLPGPGSVIRYDIAIDRFFRQGDARLFRFRFEASVDGEPLMTMLDGIAGFFTAEALEAGQGVIKTALDLRPVSGVRPDNWRPLVPMARESLDDAQVDALRRGDLVEAFGPRFGGLTLHQPAVLPGGMMRLVDRVRAIEPDGGRYGLGLIRAEADIRPDDWFMTCHFVDDQVMPGTLMFECCLHTLRIFLMRMGWVGELGAVVCHPVPGVASRLKCRGQVLPSTSQVTYEVEIKELGFRPEPYAIVDALMLADGKAIVEITSMSLRMVGLDRDKLDAIWAKGQPETPAIYDAASIRAFAIGKPSEAFGDRYGPFDHNRVIARLPGPPYQFLDRVIEVEGPPWVMAPGSRAFAEYDIPPDAWYFGADRQDRMPFAVLLEAALQPCGWLAAYMGSALTSDVDLSFRNLGGSATQLAPVDRHAGTLRTEVRTTKVSKSGGMIIQSYDIEMTAGGRPIYRGETTFGFFSKAALANQVGIRDAALYAPTSDELARAIRFDYPTDPAFPDPRWRMIDRVEELILDGGPHGLGYACGTLRVDPSAWFFEAHFYQDPVVPGSLGLESLQQLLKVVARERWGVGPDTRFESVGLGDPHRWTYRGQILPSDSTVTTRLVVTEVDDARKWIKADGFLDVDGRVIYGMVDFTLGLCL